MVRLLPSFLLALASVGLLSAAPAPKVVHADWLEKPSGEAVNKVYPDEAMRRGESGRVVLGCTAKVDGTLAECRVVSEDPPGFGFGRAALSLTAGMRMRPRTLNGEPVDSQIRIPLAFTTPGGGRAGWKIDWQHRLTCVGEVLDDVEGRAIAWPPGEENDWYGLYVTAGLRRQNLSTEDLLKGLQARLAGAGKQRRPMIRGPALTVCHRILEDAR
jgi:TonB family protein